MESSIYITLETLKYLKKGGRITPAAAAIGTVLNLKPVLQIQGEKLDAYAKVRGKKQAKRMMMKAMQEDWNTRFKQYVESGEMCLQIAYTGNKEEAEEFYKQVYLLQRVYSKKNYLWPIKDDEIRNNPKLIQNYGW